jgi:ATP-dependent Clp protease ATP-binding subunit ClpA
VFERFSEDSQWLSEASRDVVVLAQEEAAGFRRYIGTGHLLLGLLRENGVAADILMSVGFTTASTRREMARLVGEGAVDASGQIKFTPAARRVLEAAFIEAHSHSHFLIRTVDLLLGLLWIDDGPASGLLAPHADELRRQVDRRIAAAEERKSFGLTERERTEELRQVVRQISDRFGLDVDDIAQRRAARRGLRLALLARGFELTERESHVAEALFQGMTAREIAAELEVDDVTVVRRIGDLFDKLGVRTRSGLLDLLDLTSIQPGS